MFPTWFCGSFFTTAKRKYLFISTSDYESTCGQKSITRSSVHNVESEHVCDCEVKTQQLSWQLHRWAVAAQRMDSVLTFSRWRLQLHPAVNLLHSPSICSGSRPRPQTDTSKRGERMPTLSTFTTTANKITVTGCDWLRFLCLKMVSWMQDLFP